MKIFLLLAACCVYFTAALSQKFKQLHEKAILVDTHNDILTTALDKHVSIDSNLQGKTHSDLRRWKEGGVDIQVFSVWCDGTYGNGKAFNRANEEIDTLYAWINRNPRKMMLVENSRDLRQAVAQKKLGAMIGIEGGHMIEGDLYKLDSLYSRGARYMTLTWNNSTPWASSAMDETVPDHFIKYKGLTDFGKDVVREMNKLGMLIDLSHVGELTFWDAINTTTRPVLISHSCAWTLCPVFRNLKDEQILAVGRNGGVIHLNFYSGFVDSNFDRRSNAFNERHAAERDSLLKTVTDPYFADVYLFQKYADEVQEMRPPLSMLLDHLDYIVSLVGVDHVGLGSDFDGINSLPLELDDVSDYPVITRELMKRGYRKKSIRKILGGNFIRLLKANEK